MSGDPSEPQGSSTAAPLGLVFALLSWPFGAILSIVGLTKTDPGKLKGRGSAVAGLVISLTGAVISFTIAALVAIGISVEEPEPVAAVPVDQPAEPAEAASPVAATGACGSDDTLYDLYEDETDAYAYGYGYGYGYEAGRSAIEKGPLGVPNERILDVRATTRQWAEFLQWLNGTAGDIPPGTFEVDAGACAAGFVDQQGLD